MVINASAHLKTGLVPGLRDSCMDGACFLAPKFPDLSQTFFGGSSQVADNISDRQSARLSLLYRVRYLSSSRHLRKAVQQKAAACGNHRRIAPTPYAVSTCLRRSEQSCMNQEKSSSSGQHSDFTVLVFPRIAFAVRKSAEASIYVVSQGSSVIMAKAVIPQQSILSRSFTRSE